MSDVSWPAWMPEPPLLHHCYTTGCEVCRHTLLAWYAAAKQRDPDFGHIHPARMPLPPGTDFEAAKRAAFPLPEDEDGA